MRLSAFVCLSVCEQDYSKTRAWIWMKCCVSTDVGTWTNWSTFEPNPDYSPDAVTGLLSPISYALQRGISLRRENPTYWAPVGAAMRGFKMVLFTASRGNNFLGVTCPLPSTLLVFKYVATLSNFVRYADIAQLFCKSLELNRFAVHYLIPRICKIVQLPVTANVSQVRWESVHKSTQIILQRLFGMSAVSKITWIYMRLLYSVCVACLFG